MSTAMAAAIVFETMGTVLSLTGPSIPAAAEPVLREICAGYDERFSLYRPDSELCRVNRREVLLTRASTRLREVYALAEDWRDATDNAFTPHRPDGVLDLSGVVKALAIRDCGSVLADLGCHDWCLNVGGDILASGDEGATPGRGWVAGIVDPADRSRLLTQFTTSARVPALCTSGTSERGEHVWRLGADDRFRQVSVAAGDILTADVLATAILAGGRPALAALGPRYGVEVIAVAQDGTLVASGAFRA